MEQLSTITIGVSVLQKSCPGQKGVVAFQKLRFVVLLVYFLVKKSCQIWESRLGRKVIELWPMKACQNSGQKHNGHSQMEFFVISIFYIFQWLFPSKTKISHFTHFFIFFLTIVLSVLSG